ncbi:MAG: ATP-binding protein [Steroidobacteraceae bacterium]
MRERSPYVWGDPDRIQQILWHVLTNAIKFTPEHGRVSLKVTRSARHACVFVEDSGIGVAPQFLPYVSIASARPTPALRAALAAWGWA